MFGPSAKNKLFLGLLLALTPSLAQARSHTFANKSPFGLGFKAGVERKPKSDFVVFPQSSAASYGKFYSFEPFLDFGNFAFRGSASLHHHPLLTGAGSDTSGTFAETSDASSIAFGLEILLVPFYSQDLSQRFYLMLGADNVSTSMKNKRTYSSGTSYTEKVKGSGQELKYGMGYEFYFIQNYSFQLEAGYRLLTISEFKYSPGNDVEGKTRVAGETAVFPQTGLVKKFHLNVPYISLGLSLNF